MTNIFIYKICYSLLFLSIDKNDFCSYVMLWRGETLFRIVVSGLNLEKFPKPKEELPSLTKLGIIELPGKRIAFPLPELQNKS